MKISYYSERAFEKFSEVIIYAKRRTIRRIIAR